MNPPLYVSFYTPDYFKQAERLEASLRALKLPYYIMARKDCGTWVKNCALKPGFILEMMAANPGRPIVWLDADAEVLKVPDFGRMYDSIVDVARCKYAWWNGKTEVLSGTLWFNCSPAAMHLLASWEVQGHFEPEKWDQHTLETVLDSTMAVVADLPVEYCFISDLHREQHPDMDPVIVHYQHSRTTRMKGL